MSKTQLVLSQNIIQMGDTPPKTGPRASPFPNVDAVVCLEEGPLHPGARDAFIKEKKCNLLPFRQLQITLFIKSMKTFWKNEQPAPRVTGLRSQVA